MPEPPRAYDVVLSVPAREPMVLQSARDADRATLAFHTHLERLRRQRARGELAVRVRDGAERTLLRVPLLPCGMAV